MTKLTIITLGLAAAFGLSAQAQSQYQQPGSQGAKPDARFVQQAGEDNIAGMQMGKLAAQSQNSQIQQLGKEMESTHRQANQQLQSIAQSQGYQLPQSVGAQRRQQLQQLQMLSGAQFDQRFAETALKDHAQAVQLFQKEAQQGQEPQLKQFAQTMLPTVQQHLQSAQTAAQDVGVSSSTISSILSRYPEAVGGAQTPGGQGQGAGSSPGGPGQPPQQ